MFSLELLGRRSELLARPSGILGLCLVLLYGCGGGGVTGSTDATPSSGLRSSVVKAPVPLELIDTTFVPCAGDNGELVELDVREQIVTHESTDSQGRTHVQFIVNDKGTTGTGLLTGTQYRQIGATRENDLVVEDAPVVVSFANILNLVGQGQAPNLLIHETFHLTINANGVTTVEREIERIECR
ncbi:MAG TPA: hypothetical protein VIQ26_02350 [Microbacteriaceae bacterium]|jgi:hypothetical protein